MAANKKFTPRASSNLIEEEVTENKEAVETEAPVEEAKEAVEAPVAEETVATEVEETPAAE